MCSQFDLHEYTSPEVRIDYSELHNVTSLSIVPERVCSITVDDGQVPVSDRTVKSTEERGAG